MMRYCVIFWWILLEISIFAQSFAVLRSLYLRFNHSLAVQENEIQILWSSQLKNYFTLSTCYLHLLKFKSAVVVITWEENTVGKHCERQKRCAHITSRIWDPCRDSDKQTAFPGISDFLEQVPLGPQSVAVILALPQKGWRFAPQHSVIKGENGGAT